MGAKARAWVNRGLVVLAVIVGVGLILWLPAIPALGKVAILMTAAVVGGLFAFREIPAFDPLGRVHWRLPRRLERACAITFDDGPSENTRRVVEILGQNQVKATFFVLAANARRHPELLRLMAEQGHTVAIHGVTHQKLHHASEAAVERELYDRTSVVLHEHRRDVLAVAHALESAGIKPDSAEIAYIPTTTVPVTVLGGAKQLLHLQEALEEYDDVQAVFSNEEFSDEISAALDAG